MLTFSSPSDPAHVGLFMLHDWVGQVYGGLVEGVVLPLLPLVEEGVALQ